MYDTDTKNQFLELRAKGWRLSRIAERLKVSQRTLVDWNRQEHEQIRTLRAIEWETLQEKILATGCAQPLGEMLATELLAIILTAIHQLAAVRLYPHYANGL